MRKLLITAVLATVLLGCKPTPDNELENMNSLKDGFKPETVAILYRGIITGTRVYKIKVDTSFYLVVLNAEGGGTAIVKHH